MMNSIFSCFFTILISLTASGQSVELINLTISQKESKTIYIGIENKFKIDGLHHLQKVVPLSPVISIHADTIILKPNQVGALAITFHTTEGTQEVVFNARVISDVVVAIGNLTGKVVAKNDVISQGSVRLHTFNTKETFFENYKVSSFEARLNNQSFLVQGNQFTGALLSAISGAKAGDTLVFASVKATNADLGKTVQLSGTSYELR